MNLPSPPSRDGVLHLCSDFPNQHIYQELVRVLKQEGERQFIFSAVRSDAELARQAPDDPPQVQYAFRKVLRPIHRYFFRSKIRTARRALLDSVDPGAFSLVHAHYLYSDAALALRLKHERGIPFLTAVRNTDLYGFMRLRPDLWPLAKRVLAEAAGVVFLSPAYRDATYAKIGGRMTDVIREKTLIIPSGVPPVWLEHAPTEVVRAKSIRVLYVGDFSRNKNIGGTIRAVEALRAQSPTTLTLVGGGGDGESEVDAMLQDPRYAFVTRHQPIRDAVRLRTIYREHDVFAMPSFRETFGVVYLEALSQGLPIVYSRGQGVDGLFEPDTVGEGVDPNSISDIAAGISRSAGRRSSVWRECVAQANRFSWESIGRRYHRIYEQVRAGKPLGPSLTSNN